MDFPHRRKNPCIPVFLAVAVLCAGQLHAAPLERGYALAPPSAASQTEKDAAYRQARARVVEAAKKYEHTPYRFGGVDHRGLDCSGLIYLSFRDALGISVPRNAEGLHAWTERTQIEAAQPGDLLFFRTTSRGNISHVGIFVGGRRFIHAASEGPVTGVIYSSLDERYWSRTYAAVGRVFPATSGTATGGLAMGGTTTDGSTTIGATTGGSVTSDTATSSTATGATPSRIGTTNPSSQWQGKDDSDSLLIGIAAAPIWNTYFPDGNAFRGVAGQVRVGAAIKPFGKPMIVGMELRPEWDRALGVFRLPLTFSWGLSDKLRFFAGPAISFGDASLEDRRYTGGTSWMGAAGVTVAPFALKIGKTETSVYGELAWQSYFNDSDEQNFGADLAAGIRISTGLRTTWRAR